MSIIKVILKIALLIFGLLPCIYFILFFTIVGPGERTTSLFFIIIFVITAISIPGAFIFYVVDVYRNSGVIKEQKHLWAAVLFFGNVLVYPFYWYLHIWRKPKKIAYDNNKKTGTAF